LQLSWIKIDIEIKNDTRIPFFTGSMLRGVIGHALKRVVCINPSYQCENCFAQRECTFYKFYEEKNIFHLYRLGVTLQPENLNFSFYLFEEAKVSLPYVMRSIINAFEEEGIGKSRTKVKVDAMYISEQCVYDGKNFLSLADIVPESLHLKAYQPDVALEFSMPLRLKENNKIVRESFQLHTLISSIHNRYIHLRGEENTSLGYRVEGEIIASSMKYVDMQRYSNRSQTRMKIGGVKGNLMIKGLDMKSYEYLQIGEIIAAGKQTVFGLGAYTLKEIR